ncbi:MAG: tetratricopeptide repeat protein [Planctomycetes bacterium]|nr:tetratricopeptide repeat protein [Planctomycetota bacterium]
MLRIWLLSCLFLPLLAARDFAPRKPEPGYAATRTFEWKSARALEQRAEKLAGGKLHVRKVGEKTWRANASRFEAGTALHRDITVAEDGAWELFEEFPALGQAAPTDASAPHAVMRVDTRAPALEVLAPGPGSIVQQGEPVDLVYTATDDALDAKRALDIFVDGPTGFRAVATAVANDGRFSLNLDHRYGEKFIAYLIAYDRAGNVASRAVEFTFGNVPKAATPALALSVDYPAELRLYHRATDFACRVSNRGESPLSMVQVFYSLNDGRTWEFGGKNETGSLEGLVTLRLPYAQRRNQAAGNYEQVRLCFVAVCRDGSTSRPLPGEGEAGDITLAADVTPPVLVLESPQRDEQFQRDDAGFLVREDKFFVGWNAHDRNLEPLVVDGEWKRGPVSVYYTTLAGSEPFSQSWRLLARDLPAIGSFTHALDLPDGDALQVVVVAEDELGNRSLARSGAFAVRSGRKAEPDLRRNAADEEADRHWTRAVLAQREGRLPEALAEYDRALVFAPTRACIVHDKATCLSALGRDDEARRAFERALELEPDSRDFRYSLAVLLYRQQKTDDATKHLEAIVAADAAEPHIGARMLLATVHQKAGRLADAVPLWESVTRQAAADSAEYKAALRNLEWARQKAAK